MEILPIVGLAILALFGGVSCAPRLVKKEGEEGVNQKRGGEHTVFGHGHSYHSEWDAKIQAERDAEDQMRRICGGYNYFPSFTFFAPFVNQPDIEHHSGKTRKGVPWEDWHVTVTKSYTCR